MGKFEDLARRIASDQKAEKYTNAEAANQAGKEAALKAYLDEKYGKK